MTIMNIKIPDDLKLAFEKACPSETIEQAIERLLRTEVESRSATATARGREIKDALRSIRESSPSTSNDQIRALRSEGRP